MTYKAPRILVALPMAFQAGQDKHIGIMRFLKERRLAWSIRLNRLSASANQTRVEDESDFDGAIIDGSVSPDMIRACVSSGLPLVGIDWRDPEIGRGRHRMVSIDADNEGIGRLAAKTLHQISHFASHAYLPAAGEKTNWSTVRGAVFARCLNRLKIKVTALRQAERIDEQLRKLPKPAAVFAANDDIGAMILAASARVGIKVPDDLSVLGVDNEQLTCLYSEPPLASIQPDFEQAGYLAASAMSALLEHEPIRKHQTYHIKGLIPRESMEPPRSAGRLVQRAMELINNSRPSFTGIEDLAAQLGVSRRLLDLRFREIQHRSIHEAILQVKMERVCAKLKNTNLSIAEICVTSDIGSGTHPLRAFRNRFGMTMLDYRKQHRAAEGGPGALKVARVIGFE